MIAIFMGMASKNVERPSGDVSPAPWVRGLDGNQRDRTARSSQAHRFLQPACLVLEPHERRASWITRAGAVMHAPDAGERATIVLSGVGIRDVEGADAAGEPAVVGH